MTALESALQYLDAGLSILPIRADGSKAPALDRWKDFMRRPPDRQQVEAWFRTDPGLGVAVVCGAVSRNLEVIDFDDPETWQGFLTRHGDALAAQRLPVVLTPRGGAHLYLFRDVVGPTRKVARRRDGSVLVEVKGEGGYVLAPGCPAACHATRRLYQWMLPLSPAGYANV